MRNILLSITILLALVALVHWVTTHENLDKIDRLSRELSQLQDENEELHRQNNVLRRRIRALRYDPRVAERRARQDSNLAKKHETIFQFVEKDKPQTVAVIFSLSNQSATLAGQKVDEQTLRSELDTLREQVPGATLKLQFEKDLDPIRKQLFEDIVRSTDIDILD